jgi:hypothetical protein
MPFMVTRMNDLSDKRINGISSDTEKLGEIDGVVILGYRHGGNKSMDS